MARQSNHIDLRNSAGQRAITAAPGASAVYMFQAQQSRIGAGGGGKGMYNYCRGIALQIAITLTQPHTGAAAIPSDLIFGGIGSINLETQLFGTMFDPNVIQNGLIAKHLMELFQLGFRRNSVDRPYVPATADLTTTVNCELYLPFSQFWNDWPDDFAYWLGWLDTSQLELFANDSSDPFAQTQLNEGTTPATLNQVVFRAELDMVPKGNIVIPPFASFRKYYQPAGAASNGPNLIGVGNNGALQGCDDMARLMSMVFAHNAGGITGSGTADQIASITLPWRDQAQTYNIGGLFQRFFNENKMQQWGGTAVSGTAPIAQMYDYPEPYALGNGPVPTTSPLNNANARFTPLVWPMRNQLISHMQRVKGNYPLDMTFTADQSAQFNIYTHELKQWSPQKVAEMLASMGVDPTKVSIIPKYGNKNVRFGSTKSGEQVIVGQVNAKKNFCLPRSVVITPPTTAAPAKAA